MRSILILRDLIKCIDVLLSSTPKKFNISETFFVLQRLLDHVKVLRKQTDCVVHVRLSWERDWGGILVFACHQSWWKDYASINLNSRGWRSWWQEEEARDKKMWRPRWTGGSGVRRGRGGDATPSQRRGQEAVAWQQAEVPADWRRWGDKMWCNN